jgi:hypothetical protein
MILPVEYMVKGMALCVLSGLRDGTGIELPALPRPRPPMMPPSAEKMRLRSNPGVLVGTPLKSRQEI